MKLHERIAAARARAGVDRKTIADHFSITPQAVGQWETGKAAPSVDRLPRIAKLLGVRLDWLMSGTGPMREGDPPGRDADGAGPLTGDQRKEATIAPEAHGPPAGAVLAPMPDLTNMPHDVPVLGTVRGGDEGRGDFRFNGDRLGFVPRPPGLRGMTNAFCLYMQGSSMFPWRREGDPIYVQPGRPARPGDFVVVELKPKDDDGEAPEALVKLLVAKSPDGGVVLEQFSPPKRFALPGAKVLRVQRVVDWPELLRFT